MSSVLTASDASLRARTVREIVLAQALADYWKAMAADGSRAADEELARARRRIATGMSLLADGTADA